LRADPEGGGRFHIDYKFELGGSFNKRNAGPTPTPGYAVDIIIGAPILCEIIDTAPQQIAGPAFDWKITGWVTRLRIRPPGHSMTLSARARIEFGTFSPSAFAAPKFTVSLIALTCSIGMLLALPALRTLSTYVASNLKLSMMLGP